MHQYFCCLARIASASFQWLESYQREDLLAIDRGIADGSVTLTKRESKFREELEKREHEYIIYKEYGYGAFGARK